jgi:predicted PurR-regulated permease PerM
VIHRHTVQLNPLWVILAVLIGGTLLGILGALLAIPIAGIVQVLVQEWWAARRGVTPPSAPGTHLAGPRTEGAPAPETS